jgi:hypothetical protein
VRCGARYPDGVILQDRLLGLFDDVFGELVH